MGQIYFNAKNFQLLHWKMENIIYGSHTNTATDTVRYRLWFWEIVAPWGNHSQKYFSIYNKSMYVNQNRVKYKQLENTPIQQKSFLT